MQDFKASAAFLALNNLLAKEITSYNRGDQQLGYIHTSTSNPLDGKHRFLVLLGGTEGEDNGQKIIAGWNHVMRRRESGEITDAQIIDSISGLINELSLIKTTAGQWVSAYSKSLALYLDPRAASQTLDAAKTLSAADVRESAHRYLLTGGTPYTQLTLRGCEDLLTQ